MSTTNDSKLRNAYRVFRTLYRELKRSPSMAEYGRALDRTRKGAHYWIRRLEQNGYVKRQPQAHGATFVPIRRGLQ